MDRHYLQVFAKIEVNLGPRHSNLILGHQRHYESINQVFLISVKSPFIIDSKDCYLDNNKCYLRIIYRLLLEEAFESVSVLHKVILPAVGVTKECERPE